MSEMPPAGHPSAPGPGGYPPVMPPAGPWGPVGPQALGKPSRWPVFVMSLISLISVGAAVAAWLRPIPHETPAAPAAPTYTEQQIADAKSKVCAAFGKVLKASSLNSTSTAGDNPNTQLLVATIQRQVFVAGSIYLATTLADNPAVPSGLATEVKNVIDSYQVITLDGLVGDRNDPGHNAANEAGTKIQDLCKS